MIQYRIEKSRLHPRCFQARCSSSRRHRCIARIDDPMACTQGIQGGKYWVDQLKNMDRLDSYVKNE